MMNVEQIMEPGVFRVTRTTPLAELAELMSRRGVRALAVVDEGRVVGLVTDRDLVTRGLSRRRSLDGWCAADVMTPRVRCCFCEDDLEDALAAMDDEGLRVMPVLDGDKRLVGLLAREDAVDALSERSAPTPREPLPV